MTRMEMMMGLRWRALVVLAAIVLAPLPGAAQDVGLLTRPSAYSARVTVDRFVAAVRRTGWVVFTEVDHAAAASAAGLTLPPRIVILFGNPAAGTAAMQAYPTLALDLPMRVLVWQDADGRVFVTRSTGEDIAARVFARHGMVVPSDAQRKTEVLLEKLTREAMN